MAVGTASAASLPLAPSRTAAAGSRAVTDDSIPIESLYRLSVKQYHAMIRAGILTEDDQVELLDGVLIAKMSKNPPHIVATELLQQALSPLLPAGWYLSMQNPLTTKSSEPEPDAKIVKGAPRQYLKRKPGPSKIPLAIEVADKSLKRDRGVKKRIYALVRIPTYWIINLVDRCVEAYTNPTGPATEQNPEPDYRQVKRFSPGDSVPVILGGREVGRIAVDEILA
jgi:Uma2 family endonuclease